MPPAIPWHFLCWGFVGFIFQKYIRRKYFGWWAQYNYLTSAALDCGLALITLVIYFVFNSNDIELEWWGNTFPATHTKDSYVPMMPKIILGTNQTFVPDGTW